MNHGKNRPFLLAGALSAALLSACAPGRSDPVAGGGGGSARSMEEHFSGRVQPNLDFCRTCHVPGGVADVENGHDFMLSSSRSQDLANLRASWERLGRNNPTSRILLMSSGQEMPHTGGAPWPVGSAQYRNMEILLKCFENPGACGGLLGGGLDTGELLPLLGSSRGGHRWFDYCEGKDDSAVLPEDPRALVQPGVNDGKAVYYNAWWKDCHADPEAVNERAHPKNCGELRASHDRGAVLMKGLGKVGAGSFFAATAEGGLFSTTAEGYNTLWRIWGLSERPDNFDELVRERFGLPRTTERSPYPLPGEDPNLSDGGSGQLPASLTQTRSADGKWSGRIGLNCHGCHSGQIGTPQDGPGLGLAYGSGNPNGDVSVIARDLGLTGAPAISAFALFSTQRGTNNAAFFNIAALGGVRPDLSLLDTLRSGSNASGDNPAWWNMGHRPLKFWNGSFPSDAVRVDLAFFTPLGGGDSAGFVSEHAQDADHWVLAQKAPMYPKTIDIPLAEQGAILFHSKDLWGEGLDNPAQRPAGGNGSCASCHGAYSPRFVHDPAYLADPALEGVASFVVPRAVIRTDFARANTDNEGVSQALSRTSIGYPETADAGPGHDCGAQTRAATRGADRELGYLAPPLYGAWATAPYLHNGSVPDAWTLLKPSERPRLWRRVSTPARADQAGKVVMGFDTDIARAYDPQKLGWNYEVLSCGMGTIPFLDCDLLNPEEDPLLRALINALYGNLLAAWNIGNATSLLQFTPQQIEDRKIYNSNYFSQGNEGHDFTAVLTDQERHALIEYLKTL
ncbi:hypothetical protein D0B54_06115 [Solimonas sp. K1W22B-7]|uniref:c-type cytochrome n=1 Tax=Solimonas sp. K1W22B-7 TaxID=2303331 RepID=UPI000E331624|nr:hypothetical protein [Solimonas sp. K1W22B-7]AXQ28281.1 hypothetical protein D0B54_06115 [Solimonas sp. K1W22B-7]